MPENSTQARSRRSSQNTGILNSRPGGRATSLAERRGGVCPPQSERNLCDGIVENPSGDILKWLP